MRKQNSEFNTAFTSEAGNVRLCLYRDGFLKCQSTDQSLTMDFVREERIGQDKVAAHEERNNLYTYLGQEKEFHPFISKKIKLLNTDVIALFTRGIWENVDGGELGDVFAEAFSEPQELVDDVEELLLSRQPENLGKYTFATVFVNKVFIDPNRKRRIKRIIMTVIPIVIAAVILTVALILLHNKRVERRIQMELGCTDTIEYIQIDNYVRAKERCEEAMGLAEKLKDRSMQKKLGDYQKLIEAVLLAEEKLSDNQFADAQKQYKEAANRSRYVDSLGLDYIDERLKLTADYISVYDFISLGDNLALNLQYDKAEEKYLEAKATAGAIYFDEGRTEAMEALKKLYEDQKAQKEEEEQERKEKLTKQESGANSTAQGDTAFAQGDYESAKVFYLSAKQTYDELGDKVQSGAIQEKLDALEEKIDQRETKEQEAKGYIKQAENAEANKDYLSAKKYYLLAKDIYASLGMEDKVEEISRKIERLEIDMDAGSGSGQESGGGEVTDG
ncbi:MAG: hypothetical protein NC307_14860 [Roseburia sp.]|nr:hypothetical protein [Roseburia sp.]